MVLFLLPVIMIPGAIWRVPPEQRGNVRVDWSPGANEVCLVVASQSLESRNGAKTWMIHTLAAPRVSRETLSGPIWLKNNAANLEVQQRKGA